MWRAKKRAIKGQRGVCQGQVYPFSISHDLVYLEKCAKKDIDCLRVFSKGSDLRFGIELSPRGPFSFTLSPSTTPWDTLINVIKKILNA